MCQYLPPPIMCSAACNSEGQKIGVGDLTRRHDLIDIDEVVPGKVDETDGRVTFTDRASAKSYGVVDEIAGRVIMSGGRVLGVRKTDIPDGKSLAAILRYPV